MAGKRWTIGFIGLAVLAGWAGSALGETGFTATVTTTGQPPAEGGAGLVTGWTFEVTGTSSIFVTHVGVYDDGGDGLASPHEVGIWFGAELKRSLQIPAGTTGELINGYRYYALFPPMELQPNPIPPGPAYTIGVLMPVENVDKFIWTASNVVWGGNGTIKPWWSVNYPGCYSRDTGSSVLTRPLQAMSDQKGLNVNFRYNMTAYAGPDVEIYTSQVAVTTLAGSGMDPIPGPSDLTYQWLLEDGAVLKGWTPVSEGVSLALASLASTLPIGVHTLTLQVTDGETTTSDTMILTLVNTPPEAAPAPDSQVVEIGADAIMITAEVADFDGDTLDYQWVKTSGEELESGTIATLGGGGTVDLDDLVINAGDARFPLGLNEVRLIVSDRVNPPVTTSVKVEVKDSTAPTLAPTTSTAMLWPPNHEMVPVTIWANALDNNGGGAITLSAAVQSNEPPEGGGDGSTEEDYTEVTVDNAAGRLNLELRAERSGAGDGRIYTITITATDFSGNTSTAEVKVRVPHDKKKK